MEGREVKPTFAARLSLAGVVVVSVTLAILWLRFVHAPTPEAVCERLIELTEKDAGEHAKAAEAAIARLRETCVEGKRRYIRLRNRINYAEHAKCVIGARSLDDAERC